MVGKLIRQLLSRFLSNSGEHLLDEGLANLFCGELPMVERWTAKRHLARCLSCHRRQENLVGPRAERMLQLYRESLDIEELELPERPRAEFAFWLQLQTRHQTRIGRSRVLYETLLPRFLPALPGVTIGIVFGLIAGVSAISLWWWRQEPNVTANTLLVQAGKWDTASATANPGLVHQQIQIKIPGQTIQRAVYWDLQGKRRPKSPSLSPAEARLSTALSGAGVNWDQPISATDYQAWHDRQHVRADHIARSGAHLLTLTTTVPDGAVSEESLTVRDTDFHPVKRKVDFRNNETVEIAELNFAILPWSASAESVFEPMVDTSSGMVGPTPRIPLFRVPETPSPEQLDQTELAARLILNQLKADTGEQVEIRRSSRAVEVDGLVETDARKRELTTELLTVPRLKVTIRSAAHLKETPLPADETVQAQATLLPDQPSPLETCLRARGRDVSEISRMAEQIFSSALTISQESKAIVDLKMRFPLTEHSPVVATAMLQDLFYSHRQRIQAALQKERLLLGEAGYESESGHQNLAPASISPIDDAAINLALSKELTQTNVPIDRKPEAIVTDMFAAVDRIAITLRGYVKSHEDSVQDTMR